MKRYLQSLFLFLLLHAAAHAQAPLPAAVNTDPARAKVALPEPANPALPSLILIGDSTVRNGHDDGQGKGPAGQWGWGNPIAGYFDAARINVVNRAVGGLSSRTYVTSGHWERTLALVRKGDVVMMQFGHNDASAINDTSRARGTIRGTGNETEEIDNLLTGKRETVHSYGWYLADYVKQIRAKGATPVIVSLIPRKRWDDAGKIRRNADDYAGWAKEVARRDGVAFINLNELAARRYDQMGRDEVTKLFPLVTPDETVHTNWAGADLNARIVVGGIKALGLQPLVGALNERGKAIAANEDERPVVDARTVKAEHAANPALPTLHLVGDSTVKSGGASGHIGWGERIAPYFDTARVNVVNHAVGGRSSRTFYTEGRWQRVLDQLKAGDVVLIQFGHNDGGKIGDPAMKGRASGPGTGPETVEDRKADGTVEQVHTFGWYMARYVQDAKGKGATVVVLSPVPHRDAWEGRRDFENFAQWDREVAQQHGALFADLTMVVTEGYRRVGAGVVDTFFSDARTHTNEAGAAFNAQRVVAALRDLPGEVVEKWLSARGRQVAAANQ
ncbi:rhamnogalacturonan acetylesterase [Massilia sp. METH4]|uniref:rhamnogalacturonan acetylesterase n=1 Tax=Massilia sp. METH4 TaxID=3123041 RepID=UPI0030D5EE79